jgi:hypothetical protein
MRSLSVVKCRHFMKKHIYLEDLLETCLCISSVFAVVIGLRVREVEFPVVLFSSTGPRNPFTLEIFYGSRN